MRQFFRCWLLLALIPICFSSYSTKCRAQESTLFKEDAQRFVGHVPRIIWLSESGEITFFFRFCTNLTAAGEMFIDRFETVQRISNLSKASGDEISVETEKHLREELELSEKILSRMRKAAGYVKSSKKVVLHDSPGTVSQWMRDRTQKQLQKYEDELNSALTEEQAVRFEQLYFWHLILSDGVIQAFTESKMAGELGITEDEEIQEIVTLGRRLVRDVKGFETEMLSEFRTESLALLSKELKSALEEFGEDEFSFFPKNLDLAVLELEEFVRRQTEDEEFVDLQRLVNSNEPRKFIYRAFGNLHEIEKANPRLDVLGEKLANSLIELKFVFLAASKENESLDLTKSELKKIKNINDDFNFRRIQIRQQFPRSEFQNELQVVIDEANDAIELVVTAEQEQQLRMLARLRRLEAYGPFQFLLQEKVSKRLLVPMAKKLLDQIKEKSIKFEQEVLEKVAEEAGVTDSKFESLLGDRPNWAKPQISRLRFQLGYQSMVLSAKDDK